MEYKRVKAWWGIRESMGQPVGVLERVSVWWSIRESGGLVGH